jgi:hypothetical protein
MKERMCFFEKKHQKTFVTFRPGDVAAARVKTHKSFFLLFFKKAALS